MKKTKLYVIIVLLLIILLVIFIFWQNSSTSNWNILNMFYKSQTNIIQPNQNQVKTEFPNTCTPNWACGWEQCVNGYESQTAVDSNNCGLPASGNIACPALAKACDSVKPSITVTSPNGGETLKNATAQIIKWSSNSQGTVNIKLVSKNNCVLSPCPTPPPPGYTGALPDNSTYIAKNISNTGKFSWDVGQYTYGSKTMTAPDGQYRVEVESGTSSDTSDSYFNIVSNNALPSVTVTSPNGGETLVVGKSSNITWNTTGFSPSDTVYISLSDSSKYCAPGLMGCWTTFVIGSIKNTGSYTWDTNTYFGDPGPNSPIYLSKQVSPGAVYKIKVTISGPNNTQAIDSSDNNFTIVKPIQLTQ
jgi:hypothetical protein